jgi:hypothetical protein
MLEITIVRRDIFSTLICHKVTISCKVSDKRYSCVNKAKCVSAFSDRFLGAGKIACCNLCSKIWFVCQ